MDDVRRRVESDFHQRLYANTYESIVERVEDSGYFEESLTGAYSGMFPRTVGGLVSLFLETGELERAKAVIDYVLRAMEVNDMERIAHVIGPPWRSSNPVPRPGCIVQPAHPTALYRLDQPQRFGGAQEFTAPEEEIEAIELWLSGSGCEGPLILEITQALDEDAIASARNDASELSPHGDWVRFRFARPIGLEGGEQYLVRVHFRGSEGVPVWWGVANADERPLGAGHGRDTEMKPGWLDNPGHVTAFAIDTGDLQHEDASGIPILCDRDQIDGQAHVIMAWARLALRRGPTTFEDRTFELVATLMDRTSDWPYLTPYNPGHHITLAETGLVRNVCFEHSREGRFWDTFDLLSQSFVCAALDDMIAVAKRRGREVEAGRWQRRLMSLQRAVRGNMTRQLDGKTVYLEMRLPDGGAGVPFEGLGWVNLSPVAAQWEGVDWQILQNTIEAYRERALFEWEDEVALALDWWPDRPPVKSVIGKGVGWELVYCLRAEEPERICELLDLVEAINEPPIYMEAAGLGADGTWRVGDPGNGEQCSWWCWGMSKVRQAVGLPAAPAP